MYKRQVCGYIHEGDAAPEKCPLCKAPASKFNEMVETEGGLEFADVYKRQGTSSFPEDTFWPVHNLVLKTLEGEGIIFDDIFPSFLFLSLIHIYL